MNLKRREERRAKGWTNAGAISRHNVAGRGGASVDDSLQVNSGELVVSTTQWRIPDEDIKGEERRQHLFEFDSYRSRSMRAETFNDAFQLESLSFEEGEGIIRSRLERPA